MSRKQSRSNNSEDEVVDRRYAKKKQREGTFKTTCEQPTTPSPTTSYGSSFLDAAIACDAEQITIKRFLSFFDTARDLQVIKGQEDLNLLAVMIYIEKVCVILERSWKEQQQEKEKKKDEKVTITTTALVNTAPKSPKEAEYLNYLVTDIIEGMLEIYARVEYDNDEYDEDEDDEDEKCRSCKKKKTKASAVTDIPLSTFISMIKQETISTTKNGSSKKKKEKETKVFQTLKKVNETTIENLQEAFTKIQCIFEEPREGYIICQTSLNDYQHGKYQRLENDCYTGGVNADDLYPYFKRFLKMKHTDQLNLTLRDLLPTLRKFKKSWNINCRNQMYVCQLIAFEDNVLDPFLVRNRGVRYWFQNECMEL